MNSSTRLFLICLATGWCVSAHAAFASVSQYAAQHFVGSISTGPTWGNGGDAQTVTLGQNIEKTYTVNRSTNTIPDVELFLGFNQLLPQQLQGQFGLELAATGNTYLAGNIWDDASPEFNNYRYTYQLRHKHIALKGKLLVARAWPVIPWLSISMGVGFNTASNYINTPTISQADVMPGFASHTTTAFSYVLGAGIQRQVNRHWQIGAGYEFANWGRSQLNPAASQGTANALSLSHYYTSGILVNATFLA